MKHVHCSRAISIPCKKLENYTSSIPFRKVSILSVQRTRSCAVHTRSCAIHTRSCVVHTLSSFIALFIVFLKRGKAIDIVHHGSNGII